MLVNKEVNNNNRNKNTLVSRFPTHRTHIIIMKQPVSWVTIKLEFLVSTKCKTLKQGISEQAPITGINKTELKWYSIDSAISV